MKEPLRLNNNQVIETLVGHRIVEASLLDCIVTLDNGNRLRFERDADECCSWLELTRLATVENVITSARFGDNEDETGGEGAYKAWLSVIAGDEQINLAEADGDASNGYYLHGFALSVWLIPN